MPAPLAICPNCGEQLALLTPADPTWAPYLCATCSRSWWPSELAPRFRQAWRSETRDYPTELVAELRAAMAADRSAAIAQAQGRN